MRVSQVVLIVVSIVTWAFAERLFFVGLGENELNAYRESFNERVYQVWGRDKQLLMLDKKSVEYLKDKGTVDGKFQLSDEIMQYMLASGYEDVIVAIPSVVEYSFEPFRGGFLFWAVKYKAFLKVQYSFYDIKEKREIYITEIVSEVVKKAGNSAPWRDNLNELTLSAVTVNSMNLSLIDQSVYESEKVLKEVLRIKKGLGRVLPSDSTKTK